MHSASEREEDNGQYDARREERCARESGAIINEIASSAWQVDESGFPSGASIEEKLRFAVNYAILAPSSHNTQPWRFLIQRDTVQVCADRSRALPVTDPFDRELLISCGAALFNLRAALARFGCAYDITTFPYPSEPDVLALLRVHPQGHLDREIAALVPAISRRVTDRHAFPMERIAPGMQGYWNRPDETAKVLMPDGWLHTGDEGYMRADGYIKLSDRKKDIILVSGFKVFPNEVEEVAMMLPGVLEAGATSVADERSGQAVKLFIVRRDPALTAEQVLAHCRRNLTGYKVPRYVDFRTELPKSTIGKVLRRELR